MQCLLSSRVLELEGPRPLGVQVLNELHSGKKELGDNGVILAQLQVAPSHSTMHLGQAEWEESSVREVGLSNASCTSKFVSFLCSIPYTHTVQTYVAHNNFFELL